MKFRYLGAAAVAAFFHLTTTAYSSPVEYVYAGTNDWTYSTNCPSCLFIPLPTLTDTANITQDNGIITSLIINNQPPIPNGVVEGGTITTNAAGQVTDWDLSFEVSGGCCFRLTETFKPTGDVITQSNHNPNYPNGPGIIQQTWTAPPGTWLSYPITTPVPAALPLFATGLGALGLLGWRRKRKVKIAAT